MDIRQWYKSCGISFSEYIKYEHCPSCMGKGHVPYTSYDGHRTDRGEEQCLNCENKAVVEFIEAAKLGFRIMKEEKVAINNASILIKSDDF